MRLPVKYRDITEAGKRIGEVVRRTPLDFSTTFTEILGREVYFKYENLQKTGSFKIRGAYNKVVSLNKEECKNGVITASAGNHAQGVAYAASRAGIESTIVMPEGVPIAKLMATKGYGAKVILGGQSYDEAYVMAERLQKETGAVFIHAFNDPFIIAGQGTVGLEVAHDLPDVKTVVVPIGGGGLISGIAIALKKANPKIKVIGVQSAGAPSMKNSITQGAVQELPTVSTIADGIAVKHPGSLTFQLVQELVDDITLVSDEEIAEAILMMLERSKVLCEGAGAVGVAALLHNRVENNGKTVVIISGGNIDVRPLSIIIERGLIKAGRHVRINTVITDKPGALQKLLGVITETKANVISVNHDRILPRIPITQAEIQVDLETKDRGHVEEIVKTLKSKGYTIIRDEYE
ncbi:MAG: threonine ammonia-lyase [Eubacteriales bacterium]